MLVRNNPDRPVFFGTRRCPRPDGPGYTEKGRRRMIQFAERFPDGEIVATLWRQLSWSHFVELLPLDDSLKRDFYAELCRIEQWSVRTLRHKIGHLPDVERAILRELE